jgi:hypothetical protein
MPQLAITLSMFSLILIIFAMPLVFSEAMLSLFTIFRQRHFDCFRLSFSIIIFRHYDSQRRRHIFTLSIAMPRTMLMLISD